LKINFLVSAIINHNKQVTKGRSNQLRLII